MTKTGWQKVEAVQNISRLIFILSLEGNVNVTRISLPFKEVNDAQVDGQQRSRKCVIFWPERRNVSICFFVFILQSTNSMGANEHAEKKGK